MAKQETGNLFEESSQGAVGAVTAVVFILSMVLAFGGFVLMSYGVNPELGAAEVWTFAAGLAATILGFVIPFTWLPAIGK
ncbi:hypothetical protein MUN78_04955 [Leucobacter allii]|uniref:Uncharacterized protein n=1 Tax=Leucobacter allii TaxID=2932247 RepID=A0ABY4FPL5_9MICO|nr:hypothetical protein [Leucobacter allii]UOQ58197.1 hypothetical protein MUN78_04955 [Leucobacter allii]UOR02779.1 hypothetical protein MUN77_05570 [Leucobacter allii]